MASRTFSAALLVAAASAVSLSSLCTVDNVQSILPADNDLLGIQVDSSSVTAEVVTYSPSTAGGPAKRASTNSTEYCNVTMTYTHPGKDDTVYVIYAFPEPSSFANRFYTAGGGGYSLASSATGGLTYDAVGGCTDAGYATTSFDEDLMATVLAGNGSIVWDNVYMFSYQALGEMTILGKYLTSGFYGLSSTDKIYTYYEGCSDGGREGMSQVQRYGSEYDGAITGAPAFHFAQQQVLHVFPVTAMKTLDHYPQSCALSAIVTKTISACDSLDGLSDGVISRTDLCMLDFNLTSLIGETYTCSSSSGSSSGGGPGGSSGSSSSSSTSTTAMSTSTSSSSTVSTTAITSADVELAQTIYDGLFNSAGERAYLSWRIGSELSDAATELDSSTNEYTYSIPSTGGEYVTKFIELLDLDNLSNLDGVNYDTLVEWMTIGLYRYYDSLQTTLPDLREFKSNGGKLLHYHGESDPSIPSGSSVNYWQHVLSVMYKNVSHAEAVAAAKEWYQLYLIPGAAHCGANSLQPDGPYPQDNMQTMIDWVESGIQPTHLNGTIGGGTYEGEVVELCQFPTRPLWKDNATYDGFDCVHDRAGYDTWRYSFTAFDIAIY